MSQITHSPIPRLLQHRETRAGLKKIAVWIPLALVSLSTHLSADAPPVVSMMPSYNQNRTYANAAINEPIQVWGRVSGGSGAYTSYTIDFGDGTSETVSSGPQTGPATINSLTFEMLDTCGFGTYTFYLNGVALGSVGSNPANSCTCTPPLTTFTVNNAALLANWLPNSTANAIRIDVAGGQYVGWARVNIVSGASTQTAYVINGGNGPGGNGSDLCAAGYRALGGQSFTNNTLYAPVVGGGGFAVSDGPDFIKKDHAYATSGSKTVTLTVTDSAGQTSSHTSVIRVLQTPTHDERVNMAIEKGLIYLYRTQNRVTTAGVPISYWYAQTGEIGNAATGSAIQCFAESGHLANSDPVTDIYAETVQRGAYHLVTRGIAGAISTTVTGQDPDSNGNGRGIYEDSGQSYSHGFVMMGLINSYPNAAAAQAATIPAALWTGGGTAPPNFYEFIRDMLDQLSYAQSESTGGWHYDLRSSNSGNGAYDGSTHQWPNIAILTAKERWGIIPPAWVVSRSMTCIQSITDTTNGIYDGGLGYSASSQWRNAAKTGGALVGYYLGNKIVGADANADRSMKFIKRYWGAYTDYSSDGHGWFGDFYAMFALKKGLQLQGVTTFVTTPNGTSDGVVHDWYDEMSGWLLGDASLLPASYVGPGRTLAHSFGQNTNGSWSTSDGFVGSYSAAIGTQHGILTLIKSVTIPLPVAVAAAVPDQSSRFPAAFTLDGSPSYHQDTNSTIVEYLWDLDASNGLDWNNPDATGRITTANPGWNTPGNHTITLRVKDDASPANYATTTIVVSVVDTDVAPVAVPIPAAQLPAVYAGQIGGTIALNGIESYDPEGDPITAYAWDLDGNGTYGDAADAAKDTSGNGAHGVTASLVYTAEYSGQIGLRVTSTPPGGIPKSSTNNTLIDIQSAASDLSIGSTSATNVVAGTSADIQVVLVSDPSSGKDATNVVVRFYDGNPLTTGNVIGSSVTVTVPKGGTVPVNVTGLPINPGQQLVWVYVDATGIFTEFNESNNTASVNVGNAPPMITLTGPNPVTLECYVDYYTELGATATDLEDGSRPVTITGSVDRTHLGAYTVTYTATDSQGLTATTTRTVNVIDTLPPVISTPSDILVPSAVGGMSGPIFYSPTITSSDLCQGNVPVICSYPTGTNFPVGTTTVTCTATDSSGNSATATFNVVVLAYQPSPGTRQMDKICLRGDTLVGTVGTLFNVNNAYLNNNDTVIYDAALSGAGTKDAAVFVGPARGIKTALAVKGTASGAGNYGAFSKLAINNLGHSGFESSIAGIPAQFANTGGGYAVSARKTGVAPTGGGETYSAIYQPAMASNGELLTPAYLVLGSGAGATISNDTVITSSAGTVIAREGSPTSIAATNYGQLHQRVVTSNSGNRYAFTAFLEETVFNPATNTGLFVGTLGSGLPVLAIREGDTASGVSGGTISQFLGEAVNSAGEVALRASIIGTGITSLNNDCIWTNAGAPLSPPVLVAREGAIAPVAPKNKVAFDSFSTLHMNDDGSVVFFAFLKDATATPVVNSSNDGSIWRWSAGKLSLIAREGDLANNTAAARLMVINGFDCNGVGGVVYDATLVPGVGDTTTATNQAVFVDRGASDPAPLLAMRRNDAFDVDGIQRSVAGIKISTEMNTGGGTGGYGRAINDAGELIFNLTLSGNTSGLFIPSLAPPAP